MRVDCPECGAKVAGTPGVELVCPACMTPFLVPAAVQAARRFDVQPAGEAVIHGMSRHAVREAVYTRRFNATTRVRHDGGSWGLIGGYPEFAEVLRLLGDDLSPMAGTRKLAGWGRATPAAPRPLAPPPPKPPEPSATWAAAPEAPEPEAPPSWAAITSTSQPAPPVAVPTPTPTIAAPWAPDLAPLDAPIPALPEPQPTRAASEPAAASKPVPPEVRAPRTPPPIQMPHAEPAPPAPSAPQRGRAPLVALGGLVFVLLLAVFVLSR